MSKVFISYNRQSESIVRTLAGDIESLGHTVWFDQDLTGGQAWWEQILATVRDCSVFVFLLSPEGLNSTACKREYTYAAELGKPVLPVLVSDGVSINLLPPALSKIEFVDYRKQDREAAFSLARAFNKIPAPGPLPDPLPTAPDAPISYLGSLTEQVDTTATLSYPEQTALLVDLKRSLRDSEDRDDTQTLLQKLRKRRDLFATIAEDIDELLHSVAEQPPRKVPVQPRAAAASGGNEAATFLLSVGKEDGASAKVDNTGASETNTAKAGALLPTTTDRFIGAFMGAIAGFVGLYIKRYGPFSGYGSLEEMIIWSLGGAIAGAISGTQRKRLLAGAGAMIVSTLLLGFVVVADRIEMLVGLVFPSAGVGLSILIDRRRDKHRN